MRFCGFGFGDTTKFATFGICGKVTVARTVTWTVKLRCPDRSRHRPDRYFTSFYCTTRAGETPESLQCQVDDLLCTVMGTSVTCASAMSTKAVAAQGLVVLQFKTREDKRAVFQARGKLRGNPVGMDDDLTHLQQKRKNAAWPAFKDARASGKKTQWRGEKLSWIESAFRSGRKLWLEYKKRSAKPGNKRKREEIRHIHPETPMIDPHACSTRHARGEGCPVSQYLTPLTDRQVQCDFDSWINELKQQAVCNRKERSTARLCIQSTGKLPQTWSYKQYWQHMRWYSQEPRIVAYLYGPQERIECITNVCYDNGQRKFLVHWGDTYMYAKHIALHEQDGYKAKKHTRCPTSAKLHGPIGRLQIKKVEWEPSWENPQT